MTKLTEQLRATIFKSKGEMTTKGLSDKFGVSQSTIRRVFREAEESGKREANANEVKLDRPVFAKKVKADRGQTINLQSFKLKEPIDELEGGGVEMVITDDQDELDGFNKEWNGGEDEVESDDEESIDLPVPSKKDEAKLRGMEQDADNLIKEALNGNLMPPAPEMLKEITKVYEDDSETRAKFLSRIYLNVINFQDLLPFIRDKDKFLMSLHKKSTKELISLSGLIETQRSLGNVANQMKHALFVVAKGTETVSSTFLGIKAQGFYDEIYKREQEINLILQEIAVENADRLKSYTSPSMRLAMLFTSTLMLTDSRNRLANFQNRADSRPVAPSVAEKFADL